jgi:hypothetical protein
MQIGCDATAAPAAHNDKGLMLETLALERECSSRKHSSVITQHSVDAVFVYPRRREEKKSVRVAKGAQIVG